MENYEKHILLLNIHLSFCFYPVVVPYGLKKNYYCDATGKQNETLKDAIFECDSTLNCEKVLDESCDSDGPFMLCTEASIDIPSTTSGSCIYIRNYLPCMRAISMKIRKCFSMIKAQLKIVAQAFLNV